MNEFIIYIPANKDSQIAYHDHPESYTVLKNTNLNVSSLVKQRKMQNYYKIDVSLETNMSYLYNTINKYDPNYCIEIDENIQSVDKLINKIIKEYNAHLLFEKIEKNKYSYWIYKVSDFLLAKSSNSSGRYAIRLLGVKSKEDFYHKELLSLIEYKQDVQENTKINIVCQNSSGGLYLDELDFYNKTNIREEEIPILYTNEFYELYKYSKTKLESTDNGLCLFYGEPGTGKTNFIRYLMKDINKEFVYITANSIHLLDDPGFITFALRDLQNKIIIVEDAEELLKKRLNSTNNAVSNILNITDGILGNILNCSFICTFNSNLSQIDEALLRKGRLISKWEFKRLSIEDANKICEYYKLPLINKESNLAEIFNQEDIEFSVKTNKIGFS